MVTADGKLVGIMVSREKCLVLTAEQLQTCALAIPLADPRQFGRAARQYGRLR